MAAHTPHFSAIRTRTGPIAVLLALVALTSCKETPIGPDDAARAPNHRNLAIEAPVTGATADQAEPGTGSTVLTSASLASLSAAATEQGKISLSVDATGTTGASSVVQVEKPAGATVRGAYFAAASTGFSGFVIPNGGMTIDGVGVNWDATVPSSISSNNHFANVTALVKAKIDAAAAGRVDFTIGEGNSGGIDGSVLAVIFDDATQPQDNTVVLSFGAQTITGDNFFVNLANPLDKTDPNLKMDMGLGISFGFNDFATGQVSLIDVNGTRLTSCAGGRDDGLVAANGSLITAGGLDDSNANPANPNQTGCVTRDDDELYDLVPFANQNDTQILVNTLNPSNDDNIFFASFFLTVKASVTPTPTECEIDILPADPNNRITRNVRILPVAILGSSGCDVTKIDPSGITLGDGNAPDVTNRRNGPNLFLYDDVNNDGETDMVVWFSTPVLFELKELTNATTSLTLSAVKGGVPFTASDAVSPDF